MSAVISFGPDHVVLADVRIGQIHLVMRHARGDQQQSALVTAGRQFPEVIRGERDQRGKPR